MRIGKFYITQDFIEDDPEGVAKMLAKIMNI